MSQKNLTWLSPIQQFTDKDFDSNGSLKKKFNGTIAVYANWCGHCIDLHPIYQQFAKKVAGFFDVGVIDEATAPVYKATVQISGFPSILIYKDGKYVGKYENGRTLSDLIAFAKSQ
jgi:thiol-disulfide isomerase/thioredoxin